MRRSLCVFFLTLLAIAGSGSPLEAQQPGDPPEQERTGFELEQNYPNPFNPETRIPFVLREELFEGGRPAMVTVRIYNVLQQLVAVPTAVDHPGGEGVSLLELEYTRPGRHEAFWDGKDRQGREVASGIYFVQLTVNGRSTARRMFVSK